MLQVTIRQGKKEDVPQIFELIKELAVYERAEHEVENTVTQLIEDGFGEKALFGVVVAEVQEKIVGMSLYYYRYSTWKGKRLYIEDIIVTEDFRGQGIGKQLFEETIRIAKRENCTGLAWMVLDWNEPAINFYLKYGAVMDREWVFVSLPKEVMDMF